MYLTVQSFTYGPHPKWCIQYLGDCKLPFFSGESSTLAFIIKVPHMKYSLSCIILSKSPPFILNSPIALPYRRRLWWGRLSRFLFVLFTLGGWHYWHFLALGVDSRGRSHAWGELHSPLRVCFRFQGQIPCMVK